MNIAVIGLGLIGASFAKGLKKYTDNYIYGYDIDENVVSSAIKDKTIDEKIDINNLGKVDIVVVALHPVNTINVGKKAIDNMKKDSLIIDVCGIKGSIVDALEDYAIEKKVNYIGTHPMSGRELWGYSAAVDDLFTGSSFIIVVTQKTNKEKLEMLKKLSLKMQFGKNVITTKEEHDKIIAYTSQLAHVVSNSYVKSPSLLEEKGFSAGSFLDLTRVAKLNEKMWSELFVMNKDSLLFEVNNIIKNLNEYKEAIENEDIKTMEKLLREGRELKEESLKKC